MNNPATSERGPRVAGAKSGTAIDSTEECEKRHRLTGAKKRNRQSRKPAGYRLRPVIGPAVGGVRSRTSSSAEITNVAALPSMIRRYAHKLSAGKIGTGKAAPNE